MILRELIAKFGLDFDDKSFAAADKRVNALKDSVTALVTVFLGLQGLKIGFSMARDTAKFEDALTIFKAAGNDIDEFREKTKGLLSDRSLVTNFNLASQFGITKDQFFEFTKIADAAAKKLGKSQDFIFDSLISGTARASKPILDNAGILLDTEKLLKSGAAALGKTVDTITDKEKRGIIAEGVLKQGKAIIESVQGVNATTSDVFDQWDSGWDNAKIAIGGVALAIAHEVLPPILKLFATIVKGKKQIADLAVSFIKNTRQLMSPLFALLDLVGGVRTAAIALGVIMGVYLVAQVGEAVLAFMALGAAATLAKLAMFADAVLIGGAFLIIAGIIALIAEEIESLFTDKQGLFESFSGRWNELAASLFHTADTTKSFWGGTLAYIGGVIVTIIDLIDQLFDGFFKQLTFIGSLWDSFFDLFDARTNLTAKLIYETLGKALEFISGKIEMISGFLDRVANFDSGTAIASLFDSGSLGRQIFSGSVTPSASAVAASNSQGVTINNTVPVNVDASGQSLDEAQVSSLVARHVDNALTNANAVALQALTPAQGTP